MPDGGSSQRVLWEGSPSVRAWIKFGGTGEGVAFWAIRKNASTTVRNWLKGQGFRYRVLSPDIRWLHVAIVRDPYERYLSGLRQMYRHHGRRGRLRGVGNWEEFVQYVQERNKRELYTHNSDAHFEPQHWTVDELPAPALFELSQLGLFQQWMVGTGIVSAVEMDHRNRTQEEHLDYARERIDREQVERHYARDVQIALHCLKHPHPENR